MNKSAPPSPPPPSEPGAQAASALARPTRRRRHVQPAEFLRERLLNDERVIARAVISDGIFWRAAAVFILAIIVALFVALPLGALLAFVSVIMAIYAIIMKEILFLAVTNKRILVRYGLLQVDVVDIHFDKVESVELDRMLSGFIMNYAAVVIMGTGNRYIRLPYVSNGIEIRRAYNEMTLTVQPRPRPSLS